MSNRESTTGRRLTSSSSSSRLKSMKESLRISILEIEESDDEQCITCLRDVLDTYGVQSQTPGGRRDALFFGRNRVSDRRAHRSPAGGDIRFSERSDYGDESPHCDYCPKEWKELTPEAQTKLANLLSWQNLSKWEFDIVEVTELTNQPLLFVGWAILCEPNVVEEMQSSIYPLGVNVAGVNRNNNLGGMVPSSGTSYAYHYDFDRLNIDPRAVCNFLREVESRYKPNPYHNNIHAADVTQSLHCLFQLMDEKDFLRICNPVAIFSLLLAATFHDVGHPGTNNLFQKNAMTPLAIKYNDVSVLENMHSAIGHSLLMGDEKHELWDIFEAWSKEDKIHARSIMVSSILGTCMEGHFETLQTLDSLIDKVEENLGVDIVGDETQPILSVLAETLDTANPSKKHGEDEDLSKRSKVEDDHRELADKMIKMLLHAADISNPAKAKETALYWTDCALSEFFAQGDKEKEMGLPVSPLCDRSTVTRADSQIGFIRFVVQPTFELLGEMIPRVKDVIIPKIDANLASWYRLKSKRNSTHSLGSASLGSVTEE
mmetsp:Transcript_13396/g.32515  ORF Transcript_13396/g.32515 Transcript_13396/m.32515 type:complete len:545 (-) Transcript_13396:67-1701(-)